MKVLLVIFYAILATGNIWAQSGCTDPKASNYSSAAVTNNGSCTYPATSLDLTNARSLPTTLNESSALIYTGGVLWTLNDSGNPNVIYKINESNGSIIQTVTITNATNTDWEDLAADANYIYIGDFGNNADGIRTNLKVYRISKADIGSGATASVTASVISFNYSDQVIGASPGASNTNFDCEAFIVKDNVLHLFTKDWVDGHTRHYTLSTTPGNYSISPVEEFNTGGLITAADISPNNDIVLLGYGTNRIDIFMYLLYDYNGNNFFSGNKRRLNLGQSINFSDMSLSRGQTEGITFTGNNGGYISSERISSGIVVPARLYTFSVSDFILPVSLLSFKAVYYNKEVSLTWQTASELNSSFFSIERSPDAINFSAIGRENAAGNSGIVTNYQYSDKTPVEGNNYYRLKQVDIDGRSAVYSVKAVKVPSISGGLRAYTEPGTENQLIINLGKTPFTNISYQLISVSGAILNQGPVRQQIQRLAINTLSSGTYIVRLSNGESVKFRKL